MQAPPKVSILIPAYNAGRFLKKCLATVCAQTYANLQIVAVDDGSTDNTLEILYAFAQKDARIDVHTRPNRGVAATRNELLEYARGEYLLFVDADDWIEAEMVASLMDMISRTKADIAMCSNVPEFENRPAKAQLSSCRILQWDRSVFLEKFLLHRELTGSLWNKLTKASLFHEVRFPSEVAYGEDAMVTWEILKKANRMSVTDNQYYHYRMNSESVSHQGLTHAKMSALKVWDHICATVPDNDQHLSILANARRGAEMTLLLFSDRSRSTASDEDILKLRNVIRGSMTDMLWSRTLSLRFLVFAVLAAYAWPLVKYIDKFTK